MKMPHITREFTLLFITGALCVILIAILFWVLGVLLAQFRAITATAVQNPPAPVRFNLEKARDLGLPRAR